MKKYLMTGLVILLPVVLTLMIIWFLLHFFTEPLAPLAQRLLNSLPFLLPGSMVMVVSRLFSLVTIVLLIIALGAITRYFLFKNAMKLTNLVMSRIPFVKTIYKVSRDIIAALVAPDGKQAFKEAVMVPFPERPHFCMGFLSGEAAHECQEKTGQKLMAVFAPTAPHPISGFLFLVPECDVQRVDMTKEDALKYLVSCGVVLPESDHSS